MADLPVIGSCSPAATGQYWGIPECLGRLLQDGDWGPKLEGGTCLRADFPLVALLGTGGGGFWKEREVFTEFTEEEWERNKSRRWKGMGGKRCLPWMLLLFSFLLVPPEIIYTTGILCIRDPGAISCRSCLGFLFSLCPRHFHHCQGHR